MESETAYFWPTRRATGKERKTSLKSIVWPFSATRAPRGTEPVMTLCQCRGALGGQLKQVSRHQAASSQPPARRSLRPARSSRQACTAKRGTTHSRPLPAVLPGQCRRRFPSAHPRRQRQVTSREQLDARRRKCSTRQITNNFNRSSGQRAKSSSASPANLPWPRDSSQRAPRREPRNRPAGDCRDRPG